MPSPPERSEVVVRPATPADVEFTARSHRHHLPHGLFPLLGEPFMRRWHATFLDAPHGVALVAVQAGTTGERRVGFLVGAVDQVAHVQHVVHRHRWRLGIVGALSLLIRPRLALHFLQTRAPSYLRRLTGRPAVPASQEHLHGDSGTRRTGGRPDPIAVITAVAVTPDGRGAGVGAALVAAFVARAHAARTPQAQLATLAGTDGAGPFYEALGWQRGDVHPTRDGALMATYHLPIDGPDRGDPVPASNAEQIFQEGPSLHDQQHP
ncbi:GNAT family N-acetyltransferase [Aquipuribacter sp. MA13-6]|uniref:GNAT family N-acetyltransferase n=1 Tax=unclassified Aquipuribacter TaxID=2635084 RepID=UPI003EEC6116